MAYQFSSPKTQKPSLAPAPIGKRPGHNSSSFKGLITLLLLIVIIGGGIYFIAQYAGVNLSWGQSIALKSDWQAVFLDNGQVYFGKIIRITDRTVTLKNIYYLQVVTQPLQRSQEGEEVQPQGEPEQRLTLIKLGNEIHGPADEMSINRSHVIIIEDLKGDSRVVQAINDYVNNQSQ